MEHEVTVEVRSSLQVVTKL